MLTQVQKFVVDGTWTTDHTAAQETDANGNTNNILNPHDILPAGGVHTLSSAAPVATTAALAGAVPKESEKAAIPGGFPETPSTEPQSFSVNPIPASSGIGNPIHLAPGEKVPDPSTITPHTISSTVRTDEASYEKSDAAVANGGAAKPAETDASLFTLPPISNNMIPESSLPMGPAAGAGESDPGVTIQSAAPTSTTAALAGQVPKEPRGVPEVVTQSEKEAGVSPEAAANPEAVVEKREVENELKAKVPEEPATSTSGAGGIVGGIAGGLAAAGAAAAGAAAYAHSKLPESAQKAISSVAGPAEQTEHETATTDELPAVVSDSIVAADRPFEAAANPEAVAEKQAVEKELEERVKPTDAHGEPAPTITAATSATAPGDAAKENEPPAAPAAAAAAAEPAPAPAPTTTAEPASAPPAAAASATPPTSTAGSAAAKPAAETAKKDEKKKKRFSFFKKLGERLK